jgi:SAM-dependent methyltransferase
MTAPVRYGCGCLNAPHAPSGVLRSVSKCPRHRAMMRRPESLDERYYADLGLIRDGRLLPTRHVAEIEEALGPMPRPFGPSHALEVGCGVSPYCEHLKYLGHRYAAIEPSHWAAQWMQERFEVPVWNRPVEDWWTTDHGRRTVRPAWDLILAAHVVEHLDDAPGALCRLAERLVPGGQLWLVVPDDGDPVNPDHLWHFRPETLRSCIEAAGLVPEAMAVYRRVRRENFVYALARKPT